ncbi:hypothetical protein OG394_05035 [Kribbella sp. NBC_01245]|uniref:hypothetical protein n=1 Tax=Kribbella sp. NBC_01245 TaxID=2903578 RepID=UPI002E2BA1D5|nr:hypothetical protein [Kribbella sp. NBC_01245]
MITPLAVGWSDRTGDWVLEPFGKLSTAALNECDVVRVSLETTDGPAGLAIVDIKAPDVVPTFRLYFETKSASLKLEKIDIEDPVDEYGRIDDTSFAEPDWYFLRTFRCDLEIYSDRQYFEWLGW